jgi:hypothetical protein
MKLQFTNGYLSRFDQISRILKFLLTQDETPRVYRKDIIAELGIPDKQIENLTSMMTGFGLVKPRSSLLTPLGKTIIQSDPYFEKIETLWIIHYLVSSNPNWVIWHRIINNILPMVEEFEVEQISSQYFSDLGIHFSERTISQKLPTEVSAVFASYARSEFSNLHLLTAEKPGHYIKSIPVEIPPPSFLYCLLEFRDKYSPGSSAMNIDDVCLVENSPGRVLNLPDYQIRTILSDLHDASLIRLEQLANLDQVRFFDNVGQNEVLQRIYGVK